MTWTVYILYSKKDTKLYVGCTSDIQKRYQRHCKGYVQATAYRRPLVLIHTEKFSDKGTAFQRERFLKSLWGAREKKKILNMFYGAKTTAEQLFARTCQRHVLGGCQA